MSDNNKKKNNPLLKKHRLLMWWLFPLCFLLLCIIIILLSLFDFFIIKKSWTFHAFPYDSGVILEFAPDMPIIQMKKRPKDVFLIVEIECPRCVLDSRTHALDLHTPIVISEHFLSGIFNCYDKNYQDVVPTWGLEDLYVTFNRKEKKSIIKYHKICFFITHSGSFFEYDGIRFFINKEGYTKVILKENGDMICSRPRCPYVPVPIWEPPVPVYPYSEPLNSTPKPETDIDK